MRFLSVEDTHLHIAVEEMQILAAEISGDMLVEAPDVQEELNDELERVQLVRQSIAADGMSRDSARQLNDALEGFLVRHHISSFTTTPSIEGMAVALEAADEKRLNIFHKIVAWFSDKLRKMIDWIGRLFGKDGKATKVAQGAKAMAEEASNARKPQEVDKMVRDPAAASQSARIDPSEEKSGTYEDFVDALQKLMEPVQGDMNKLYARLNSNAVMRTVATNPEAVTSFFEHMEATAARAGKVREIVDAVASKMRSIDNVHETVNEIRLSRNMFYRALGGESAEVLSTIRQQQFTDQNAHEVTFDSVPYDKLVETMTAVTKNIGAANSEGRIRELTHLDKALQQLSSVAETNVVKRLSDSDRDVVLSALNGLINDIASYQSADMQNWNVVLQLYTGVASFWNAELRIYYRCIGAIQRAASQVFSDTDRKAVLEEFKKKGFATDMSAEDLVRRGVGMEHFQDSTETFASALESYASEMPEFPDFSRPVHFTGSLLAALEADDQDQSETAEQKQGILAKLREWFEKIVGWIRAAVDKFKAWSGSKVDKAKDTAAKQQEAVNAAKQSKGSTEVLDAIRPEVKKAFMSYFTDSAWWSTAEVAKKLHESIASSTVNTLLFSPEHLDTCVQAISHMHRSMMQFMQEASQVKEPQQMLELQSAASWNEYRSAVKTMREVEAQCKPPVFSTLQGAVKAFAAAQRHANVLKKLNDSAVKDMEVMQKHLHTLRDLVDVWQKSEAADNISSQAAQAFHFLQQMPMGHMKNMGVVVNIYSAILHGGALYRPDMVEAIFADIRKKNPEAQVADWTEMLLLASDEVWGVVSPATEAFALCSIAMESLMREMQLSTDADFERQSAQPFYGGIALEEDAGEQAKQGALERVRAWFSKIWQWLKDLFKKRAQTKENYMQQAEEIVVKHFRERKKAEAEGRVLRVEVAKIFQEYMHDAAWYEASDVRTKQDAAIKNAKLGYVYTQHGNTRLMQQLGSVVAEISSAIHSVGQCKSLGDLAQANIETTELEQLLEQRDIDPGQERTMAHRAVLFGNLVKHYEELKTMSLRVGKAQGELTKAMDALEHMLGSADAQQAQHATAAQKKLEQLRVLAARLLTLDQFVMSVSMECVMAVGVQHEAVIKEIFAHYNEHNPETPVQISQNDIRLMSADKKWSYVTKL